MAFPESSVVLLDNFNRAEGFVQEGAGSTIWENKQIASSGAGQLKTVGEKLAVAAASVNSISLNNFGPDLQGFVEVTTLPSTSEGYFFIACRINEPSTATWDGYGFIFIRGAGGWTNQVRRYTNAASTVLGANNTTTFAVGDSMGWSLEGKVLKLWRKPSGGAWEELASREDTTYTAAGKFGVELGDTTGRYDNLNMGTLVASAAAFVPHKMPMGV